MFLSDITPLETRQFELLVRRSGADPAAFQLRKFQFPTGKAFKVRVVGRGTATVYEGEDSTAWMGQFANDVQAGVFGTEADAGLPPAVREAFSEVEQALAQNGLPGALDVLNRRVPHRFTAVYRLVGPSLHNVATVDKHRHLEPLDLRVVPLTDSFCQFVLRDGLFLTPDSGADQRLEGHPYSGVVGSYAGVPVRDRVDKLAGTLCHFDLATHDFADEEYLLLDRVARLLPAFLRP